MKKALALILAMMMVLCTASFAVAEDAKTLTVVAWDAGTTPYLAAQKEAFEEAGIYGRIYKPSLGKYSIRKWDGKCRIKVFAMEVTQILDKWPEDILRKRQWYNVEEAAGMVRNKKLQAMMQGLPEYLED